MSENGVRENKRAVLFVNLRKEHAQVLAGEIRSALEARSFSVGSFAFEGKPDLSGPGPWGIAFSLGGDGTALYTARFAAPLGVPIMPVNLGTLGFIADVKTSEWQAVFDQWLLGRARISKRFMLDVDLERRGKKIFSGTCLNDVVICASGIAKLIRLKVYSETGGIPGRLDLGSYRADGLIIATPTGSTAYSMAAGGPMLDPEMKAIILNPICPFTLSSRPFVLPPEDAVIVEVEKEQRSGVLLTVDGQETEALEGGDRVTLRRASHAALLIASDREAFYRALRTKLSWSGDGEGSHA
jgi:NAD+ kinase